MVKLASTFTFAFILCKRTFKFVNTAQHKTTKTVLQVQKILIACWSLLYRYDSCLFHAPCLCCTRFYTCQCIMLQTVVIAFYINGFVRLSPDPSFGFFFSKKTKKTPLNHVGLFVHFFYLKLTNFRNTWWLSYTDDYCLMIKGD